MVTVKVLTVSDVSLLMNAAEGVFECGGCNPTERT